MTIFLLVIFSIATAVAASWLAAPYHVVVAGVVTFLVPYIASLYVGHHVVGIAVWHLLVVAFMSSVMAVLLKRFLQQSMPDEADDIH